MTTRSVSTLRTAGACLLSALAALACRESPAEFRSQWPAVDRVWVGPEYYANRLMDWRLRNGRLESVEGSRARPMRTIHLLTHAADPAPGTLSASVRTGPIASDGPAHEHTWTGLLIGVGGPHVDFRISALSHHWPAPDGGLIVGWDGTGRIIVRDNSGLDGPKGAQADIPIDAWPLRPPERSTPPIGPRDDVVLQFTAIPTGMTYQLDVTVSDPVSFETLASARYTDLAAEYLDGNLALVSHHSPRQSGPGYWFRDWEVRGTKLRHYPGRTFGPVMGAMHTLSDRTLKMTAQMGPLGPADSRTATLEIDPGTGWEIADTANLDRDSYTVQFQVDDWDVSRDTPYRVVYDLVTGSERGENRIETFTYRGTVRHPPSDREEFVLGSLNCIDIASGGAGHWNHGSIWYPHNELVAALGHHDPDLLFFAGDQIYEGGLAGIVREPTDAALLDYLYHWYRWVWAFRDLTRDIPTIAIPDDHDVYHGNIWGAGGIAADGPLVPVTDNGGYRMDPRWVNAVHRTQTSHLPDPFDPTPIEQGITVYYTGLEYAGVSFAIIADRMFKSAPAQFFAPGTVVNGWIQDPAFDPLADADPPGATLLGNRQLEFLETWAADWSGGTWMKVVLSQTLFNNLATIPADAASGAVLPGLPIPAPGEYPANYRKAADMDSNGWPPTGRDRALRAFRKAFAPHVAGDQHLGSVVQYGLDRFNDASYAFVVPATANLWPRRWFPPDTGANREPDAPRYTGEFLDGFGNRMTVLAAGNPVRSGIEPTALYDRMPGYGVVRLHRASREITFEAWPRWVDPSAPDASMFEGWPVRFDQLDNGGRGAAAHLPTLRITGVSEPVVQVIDETSGAIEYTVRIAGTVFRPPLFGSGGPYTVRVGDPDLNRWEIRSGVVSTGPDTSITIAF